MEQNIKFHPNYKYKKVNTNESSARMKKIHSIKYSKNIKNIKNDNIVNQQFRPSKISDILLDCEYMKEICDLEINHCIPSEWNKYSLDDFISNVFHPIQIITNNDIEEFILDMETPLYFEETNYASEEERE